MYNAKRKAIWSPNTFPACLLLKKTTARMERMNIKPAIRTPSALRNALIAP